MKMVQIMPAGGWDAIFKLQDGKLFRTPLAGWALIIEDEVSGMEGISADMDGFTDRVEQIDNFVGYAHESERHEIKRFPVCFETEKK